LNALIIVTFTHHSPAGHGSLTVIREVIIVRVDDFVASVLALTAWRYTKEYGGYMVGFMVMSVLCNREKAGWGSLMECIEKIPEFSAVLEQPNQNSFPETWAPGFVKMLQEAPSIRNGNSVDLSHGALYWCDIQNINNPWFQENVMNKKEMPSATLNSFYCYR